MGWRTAVIGWLLLQGCAGEPEVRAPVPQHGSSVRAPPPSSQGWPAWGLTAPLAQAQTLDLRQAELRRDPLAPVWRSARSENDPRRDEALWRLARVGGSTALDTVLDALEGPVGPAVLAAAGLLEPPRTAPGEPPSLSVHGPWGELEDRLWTHYLVAEGPPAEALLFAIGRTGGARSVARLAVDLSVVPADEVQRGIAAFQALAILCSRGYPLSELALKAVAQALQSPSSAVQSASAYALSRCALPSSELLVGPEREVLAERLGQLTQTLDDEGRRLAWRALAGIGTLAEPIPVEILGPHPPAWLVEVEAVRALTTTAAGRLVVVERLLGLDLGGLVEPRTHVVWAALEGLRPAVEGSPELVDRLQPLAVALAVEARALEPSSRWIRLQCEIAVLQAVAAGSLDSLSVCDHPAVPEKVRAEHAVDALLLMGSSPRDASSRARLETLLTLAQDEQPVVSIPALRALAEIEDDRVNPILRAALGRADLGVLAAAAGAVAVRAMDAAKRDLEAVEPLTDLVHRAADPGWIEARLAGIEALGSLARTARAGVDPDPRRHGRESLPEAPWMDAVVLPLATDSHSAVRRTAREALLGRPDLLAAFDAMEHHISAPSLPMSSAEGAGLRIVTEIGAIEIVLARDIAPANTANLLDLAAKGFFDGLDFHRVVPGFVVQGGDPRGDGYGGPGHWVPCEWSTLRYERGTVGMALAGKDTGGSQFFITQAPQPHLDGRYTVVGQVTAGMDVVDRLLPGTRIERVEVLGSFGGSSLHDGGIRAASTPDLDRQLPRVQDHGRP